MLMKAIETDDSVALVLPDSHVPVLDQIAFFRCLICTGTGGNLVAFVANEGNLNRRFDHLGLARLARAGQRVHEAAHLRSKELTYQGVDFEIWK